MADVVLDASALLALLNAEPGSEEVARTIPGAAISTPKRGASRIANSHQIVDKPSALLDICRGFVPS